MEIAKGTVISGRYRLLEKLGQGGMGSVWQAEHCSLRTPLAIKLMGSQYVESPEARRRFEREAQAAAALSLCTKHVVRVQDYGIDGGLPFIAMELLVGEDLARRFARVGRLEPAELCSVLSQVGKAISLAHDGGIVHRDLKPANIFLTQDEDTGEELVKVLDFGIAKAESQGLRATSVETSTGAILGSPRYMSPEQISGKVRVDARTDVWALAVIAFEALTGKRPFEADSLPQLTLVICTEPLPVPSQAGPVPPGFDEWFAQAAARDRSQRFESVGASVAALLHACGVQPAVAPKRRRWRALGLAALGVGVVVAVAALWLRKGDSAAPPGREDLATASAARDPEPPAPAPQPKIVPSTSGTVDAPRKSGTGSVSSTPKRAGTPAPRSATAGESSPDAERRALLKEISARKGRTPAPDAATPESSADAERRALLKDLGGNKP